MTFLDQCPTTVFLESVAAKSKLNTTFVQFLSRSYWLKSKLILFFRMFWNTTSTQLLEQMQNYVCAKMQDAYYEKKLTLGERIL